MENIKIINIDGENISEYPPTCFLNPENEGYQIKLKWLKKRFSEGMKIKQLYLEGEKKTIGFIEYTPGEFAWRAVEAKGFMFIHCIWITPNKNKNKGYGSFLIKECLKDAKKENKDGVAAVTSDGPFMAGKDLFLKNKFKSVDNNKPFDLMVKVFKNGHIPKFKDTEKQLKKYKGWDIIYSNQCPWVSRFINEIDKIAKKKKLKLKITELKTAKQAQNAPSIYAVFNLVYNGKLLADHYISERRFLNIVEKEMK